MGIDEDYITKELEISDIDWIFFYLNKLHSYLEYKSEQKIPFIVEPKLLERYFPAALADLKAGELSEKEVLYMFGVGFGQCFTKAGFDWVIYSGEYGPRLLVIQNKTTKVMGFPFSTVEKRLTDETAGRFDVIFATLTS